MVVVFIIYILWSLVSLIIIYKQFPLLFKINKLRNKYFTPNTNIWILLTITLISLSLGDIINKILIKIIWQS